MRTKSYFSKTVKASLPGMGGYRCPLIVLLLMILVRPGLAQSPDPDCNIPLVGNGKVIDRVSGGTLCLLCNSPDADNLLDGDLSNYVAFNSSVSILSATPVVSIRDVQGLIPAGRRAGFVIEPDGGLLQLNLLANFQIRTYLNNSLQETATVAGGLLNLNLLGGEGRKQRLSFVTSQPFDEIELVVTSTLSGFTSLRVYYAFHEENGCNYTCQQAFVQGGSFSPTYNASRSVIVGTCVLCAIQTQNGAITTDTLPASGTTLNFGVASIGASISYSVNLNTTIQAGNDFGFAVGRVGLLGLLNLSLLENVQITTFLGTDTVQVINAAALAQVGVLPGSSNVDIISFNASSDFDGISIRFTNTSVLGLSNVVIVFPFLRRDSDADGMPDCVDKCPGGDDLQDADGDGFPDDCDDPVCLPLAGDDVAVCPPATTASLPAAPAGYTWTDLPGNPSPAMVAGNGQVTGLTAEGEYYFVLSNGLCSDTVVVSRRTEGMSSACNDPVTGPFASISSQNPFGGICLICSQGGAANIVDGNLNNYFQSNILIGLLAQSFVIVRDSVNIYPGGTRAGYVISVTGGLLDLNLLNTMALRTRLNGVVQETAIGAGLVNVSLLPGTGGKFRLSFVASQPFNEIEFFQASAAVVAYNLRIYYAFTEDAASCPEMGFESCLDVWDNTGEYAAGISGERTGLEGILCTACELVNIGNLIDADTTNFARIYTTIGVGNAASLSVRTPHVVKGGAIAGFNIGQASGLLDLNVLNGIRLRTYLGGVLRDDFIANNALVSIALLGATNRANLYFPTTGDFDEIQITSLGLAGALTQLDVYYAFSGRDSDGDGTLDCFDKCCGGDDGFDTNGNGVPDACDGVPFAEDDLDISVSINSSTVIDVLANDGFGPNGPGTQPIEIVTAPEHGTADVDDGGTPDDPTDDVLVYTPDTCYTGLDSLSYRICDATGSCDTAWVFLEVIDDQAPELTCPAPLTLYAGEDCEGGYVSVHPALTDTCAASVSLQWTYTHPDGTVTGPEEVVPEEAFSLELLVGSTAFIYEGSDDAGNTVTCSFTVEVQDTLPPVLNCPASLTVAPDENCMLTVTDNSLDATAADNCTPSLLLQHDVPGAPSQQTLQGATFMTGLHQITWSTVDEYGNTATCSFTLSVADDTPPVITGCADATLQLTEVGSCAAGDIAAEVLQSLSAADNCDGAVDVVFAGVESVIQEACEGADPSLYIAVYRYEAADASGNTSSCTLEVTVEYDVTPEFVLCQDLTASLGADGTVTIDRAAFAEAVVDLSGLSGCDILDDISYSIADNLTFGCADIGENELTVTATLCTGASAVCEVTITVQNDLPPVFTGCADRTVSVSETETCDIDQIGEEIREELSAGGICAADIEVVYVGVFEEIEDVCEGPDPSVYRAVLQYTATDASGNVSTCMLEVTVDYDIAPVFTVCADATVYLDGNGAATLDRDDIAEAEVPAGSFAGCDFLNEIVYDQPGTLSFDCSDLGENDLEIEAMLCTGATAVCQVTVIVLDTLSPELAGCADVTLQLTEVGSCAAGDIAAEVLQSLSASDNCDGAVDVVFAGVESVTQEACEGADPSLYIAVYRYEAADASGNTVGCTLEVTVEYDVVPEFTLCQDLTIGIDESGQRQVEISEIAEAEVPAGSFAGCDFLNEITYEANDDLLFTCADVGEHTVLVTATLCTGAAAVCEATITVVDEEEPAFINCADLTLNLSEVETCDPIATGLYILDELAVSFNCGMDIEITLDGVLDIEEEACDVSDPGIFRAVYGYTATSELGDTAYCELTATVIYDAVPQFTVCADATVYLDGNGAATLDRDEIAGAEVPAGSFAGCDFLNEIVYDQPGTLSFDCSDLGENDLEIEAMLCTGAMAVCQVTVTVLDTLSPELAGCADVTLQLTEVGSCAAGDIAAEVLQSLSASDNCDGAVDVVFAGVESVIQEACEGVDPALYIAVYRYEATDAAGNTSSCTLEVTVEYDVTPEFVLCQDLTASLGADGTVTIDRAAFAEAVVDLSGLSGCDILDDISYSVADDLTFGCADIGENELTVTATLCTGASAVCEATITVQNDMPPVFTGCADRTVSVSETETCDIDQIGEEIGEELSANGICAADIEVVYVGVFEEIEDVCEGPDPSVYRAVLQYTATDASGNVSTCMLEVTVDYDIAPQFTVCADATVYLDGNGAATLDRDEIAGAEVPAGSFAGCDFLNEIVYDQPGTLSFDCSDLGENELTVTASLCTGATAVCQVTVTVLDTLSPELAGCADVTLQLTEVGSCAAGDIAAEVLQSLSASDNCDGAVDVVFAGVESVIQEACEGVDPALYVAVYRYEAVDASGNTSGCTLEVTVEYDVTPEFTLCQDLTIIIDESGQRQVEISEMAEAEVPAGSFAGCDFLNEITYEVNDDLLFTCADVGEHTVLVTATLCTGAAAMCEATITVVDEYEPAFINCADLTLALSEVETCDPTATGAYILDLLEVAGSCGSDLEVTFDGVLDIEEEACDGTDPGIFRALYGYTATSEQGDTVRCELTATVIYDAVPQFTVCADAMVYLDAAGSAALDLGGIAEAEVPAGSFAGCDFLNEITYDQPGTLSFDCSGLGENELTVTASLCTGATAACQVTVTVLDTLAPELIDCESVIIKLTDLLTCDETAFGDIIAADLEAEDNCDEGLSVYFDGIVRVLQEACARPDSALYEAIYRFVAEDGSGNTSSCILELTVEYDVIPEFVLCQDLTISLDADGQYQLEMDEFAEAMVDLTGFTGCEHLSEITYLADRDLLFTCADLGEHVVKVRAEICTGIAAVCEATITVQDLEEPVFTNCTDLTLNLTELETCDPAATGLYILDGLEASFSCGADFGIRFDGVLDIEEEACDGSDPGIFRAVYGYTATSELGDSVHCELTAMVIYDVVPQFTVCADATVYLDASGSATLDLGGIAEAEVPAGSFAGCDFLNEITYDQPGTLSFDCSDLGENELTVTASLCTGATAVCAVTVTVLDTFPTMIVGCAPVILNLSDTENCVPDSIAQILLGGLTLSGNCDGGSSLSWTGEVTITKEACTDPVPSQQQSVYVFVATDSEGNTEVCELEVTLLYDEAPVFITCRDTALFLGADGTLTLSAEDLVEAVSATAAYMGCQPAALSYEPADELFFDCEDIGNNQLTFTVADCAGNTASCEINLLLVPEGDGLEIMCPGDITLGCGVELDPSLNSDLGAASLLSDCGDVEDFVLYYEDEFEAEDCDGIMVVTRSWRVDLPSGNQVSCIQLITLEDDGTIQVEPIDPEQETGEFECLNTIRFVRPAVLAGCTDIIRISVSGPGFSGDFLHIQGDSVLVDEPSFPAPDEDPLEFDFGQLVVVYTIEDRCGRVSTVRDTIEVDDTEIPFMICQTSISVAVGSDCTIRVPAHAFDIASYDFCSDITLAVARTHPSSCYNPEEAAQEFGPSVRFCCTDFGADPAVRTVVLRATDAAGNSNHCTVMVEMQDKAPVSITCPPDVTVADNGFATDDRAMRGHFGDIAGPQEDRRRLQPGNFVSVGGNDGFLDGFIRDNCHNSTCAASVGIELILPGDCAAREISRVFTATDLGGNTAVCTQSIVFEQVILFDGDYFRVFAQRKDGTHDDYPAGPYEDNTPDSLRMVPGQSRANIRAVSLPGEAGWDIVWPADLLLYHCPSCLDPAVLAADPRTQTGASPYLHRQTHALMEISYEDKTVHGTTGCSKILRNWTIEDPCAPAGQGLWTWTQVIEVRDTVPPVVKAPSYTFMINGDCVGDGLAEVELTATAKDNCSAGAQVSWTWEVYPFSDPSQTIRHNGPPLTGERFSLRRGWPLTPEGAPVHIIRITAKDACGNTSVVDREFTISDNSAPLVECRTDLQYDLSPLTKTVEVHAADGFSVVDDNCNTGTQIRYRIELASAGNGLQAPAESHLVFGCDDLGTVIVRLWAGDAHGNWSHCLAPVVVSNNLGADCSEGVIAIEGSVRKSDGRGIAHTEVRFTSTVLDLRTATDASGRFAYDLPANRDYKVGLFREGDPRSGISTRDLLIIQRHILGKEVMTDPYGIIAADVDKSHSVTASDLAEIRRVILGRSEGFVKSGTWRFIPRAHLFDDPADPLSAPVPEHLLLRNLHDERNDLDFVAVKTGDVNHSAPPDNGLHEPIIRQSGLLLSADDIELIPGETHRIAVRGENIGSYQGYQFTLEYDRGAMDIIGVSPLYTEMTADNFGFGMTDKGMVTTSWHTLQPSGERPGEAVLFELLVEPVRRAMLSEVLRAGSGFTAAEAIDIEEQLRPVQLVFGSSQASGAGAAYALFQNVPNPFTNETVVQFTLPEAMPASLTIYDLSGRIVAYVEGDFARGLNQVQLHAKQLGVEPGVYFYRLVTDTFMATKKMIITE